MSAQQQQPDDDEEEEEEGLLLCLENLVVDVENGERSNREWEAFLAHVLQVSAEPSVSILENDKDIHRMLFVVYSQKRSIDETVTTLNEYAHEHGLAWRCGIPEMEEEVEIDPQQAYTLWRDLPDDETRTSHLSMVTNPDGHSIQPSHHYHHEDCDDNTIDPIQKQLRRDPFLLQLDNTRRVDLSQLLNNNETMKQHIWLKPFVITGCGNNDKIMALDHHSLRERFGTQMVRTGNRHTLIHSGFDNSKPMALSQALDIIKNTTTECGCMVFSPLHELVSAENDLQQKCSTVFPPFPFDTDNNTAARQKYTLCLAGKGFGIGMHKHKAAFFWLSEGRKKWYLCASTTATDKEQPPTHPAFYTTQSTHKCLQNAGEILYVPDDWYHEIFNLSPFTAGIQALPDDE